MFPQHSTLMVPAHVIEHFKRSCPEQIARTFWLDHCLPCILWCGIRKEKTMKKGDIEMLFCSSLCQNGSYVLWIRDASLRPSENSMSKEMMWCLMMDRAFFFLSLSLLPPTVQPYSIWPQHVGKGRWNKIEKPISPPVWVCQQHIPHFCMIPAVRN